MNRNRFRGAASHPVVAAAATAAANAAANAAAGTSNNANSPSSWAGGAGFGPNLPSYGDLSAFDVNRPGWETVRQTLYDSQQYVAAGATQLSFFQVPIGQGTSWAGGGTKSRSDTNMLLAGNLPANQEYLVQSIEVEFFPTTPTVAAAMPAANGATAIAVLINDAYIFRRAGNLILTIGSKDYLTEAPLSKFPTKTRFELHAAVSNTTATNDERIAFGDIVGRPYNIAPASLRLVSNQNFAVTLNWPEGVQAISNPARVFVRFDGILYRRSQ